MFVKNLKNSVMEYIVLSFIFAVIGLLNLIIKQWIEIKEMKQQIKDLELTKESNVKIINY